MRTIETTVKIADTRAKMGQEAAEDIGAAMEAAAAEKPVVTMCFAAAPSQDDMLEALVEMSGLPWEKVVAFHLDEYIDLPRGHANTFEVYLNDHLFNHVPVGDVHFMADMDGSPEEQAKAYEELLREHGGIDISCIGIGENGHIAFNEPGSPFFTDKWCDLITIDEKSIKQQYRDYKDHPDPAARYESLDDVPRNAITMTIPAICASREIFCVVPAEQKAEAVEASLEGPITDEVAATALRTHPAATFYLDQDSAQLLTPRVGG